MNLNFKLLKHDKAVSAIIGWFLVLILLSTATAVILLASREAITEKKNISVTDSVAESFKQLDNNIFSSVSSSDVSKTVDIPVDRGSLDVDPRGNRIAVIYTYSEFFEIDFDGLDKINFDDSEDDIKTLIISNNLIDYQTVITPDTGEKYPNEADRVDVSKISSGTGLLIQVRHVEYPLDDEDTGNPDPAYEEVPFCAIWIFDLGRLTYDSMKRTGGGSDLLESGTSHKVIYENRGVIRDSNANSYVQVANNVFSEQTGVVQLNMQLIRGGSISVSGGGVYQLDFEIKDYYIRNKENPIVYNLKMKMHGDYIDEWYDYLTTIPISSNGFARQSSPNQDTLLFNNGQQTNLVFSTFVVNVIGLNLK